MAEEEPLLSDEETSALLDAMREDDRVQVEARATDLGSPEGPLREALARADAAGRKIAEAARLQLLRQLTRGVEVEALPAEIVPRDVLTSAIDPRAVRYGLASVEGGSEGQVQGLLVVDTALSTFVLDRSMGGPERAHGVAALQFSALDRRILEPFPRAVVDALCRSFLRGRKVALAPHDEAQDAGAVRFEPMLRTALRISCDGARVGELWIALDASAVGPAADDDALAPREAVRARARIADRLFAAEVDVAAVLGRAASSVRQLLSLGRGDVLRLDGAPSAPVRLYVEDVVVAHGSPIVAHGDLAVELLDLVSNDPSRGARAR